MTTRFGWLLGAALVLGCGSGEAMPRPERCASACVVADQCGAAGCEGCAVGCSTGGEWTADARCTAFGCYCPDDAAEMACWHSKGTWIDFGAYEQCSDDSDCSGVVDGCVLIARVGICTNDCMSNSDCPHDMRGAEGACLVHEGARSICYERCSSGADCASGFACSATEGGVTICLPE